MHVITDELLDNFYDWGVQHEGLPRNTLSLSINCACPICNKLRRKFHEFLNKNQKRNNRRIEA